MNNTKIEYLNFISSFSQTMSLANPLAWWWARNMIHLKIDKDPIILPSYMESNLVNWYLKYTNKRIYTLSDFNSITNELNMKGLVEIDLLNTNWEQADGLITWMYRK